MYYRLTNFYQNHRRYVQSLDLNQLKGDAVSYNTIKGGTCDPLAVNTTAQKVYYPCGLIANSFFNDTIGRPQILDPNASENEKQYYEMTTKGIAWDSDKELIKNTKYNMDDVLPPPNWVWASENGVYKEDPKLHENEAFMVWMRTAGLPSFSKLSRRNDTHGMPAAKYSIEIVDSMCYTYHLLSAHFTKLFRFQCDRIRWNKVDLDLYSNSAWRQESLHGNRLCGRGWNLRCSRGFVHCCALGASEV